MIEVKAEFMKSPYSTWNAFCIDRHYSEQTVVWGTSQCPTSWGSDGGRDCYKNSAYVAAPDMPITKLGSLTISGAAVAGGKDTVVFNNGTKAYSIYGP